MKKDVLQFYLLFIQNLTLGLGVVILVVGTSSCSSYSKRNRSLSTVSGAENFDLDSIQQNRGLAYGKNFDVASNELNEKSQAYRNESIFDWPIDRARLSRGYNPNSRRPHLGIDLAAPKKTPVFAAHQGLVIYAGRDFRGFGKMILIESGHGWATLYAHLDRILVEEGQKVKIGESIGLVGNTGRSSGPHLHFEIRKNKGPVDPLLYLPGGLEAARKLGRM